MAQLVRAKDCYSLGRRFVPVKTRELKFPG